MLTSSISPSPVAAAFSGIQWDPLGKLRLTNSEKSLLRSGEDNPTDYTLGNVEDACHYVRALLKVLAEASGSSGPSSKVSHLRDPLPVADALQLLYVDALGVVTHYAISKLVDVISCLMEKKDGASVSMVTTFFEYGNLIDDWRPLLRVLHLGGSGDPYAQRGSALCLAHILMAGCPSQARAKESSQVRIHFSSVEEPLQALISWITSQLQCSSGASLSLVTPTLSALVSCKEARYMFSTNGGIGYISRHLRDKQSSSKSYSKNIVKPSVQQLYELSFCIWLLTYECENSSNIRAAFHRDGAIKSLVNLVSTAPREKVVRVALSALRNLATCTSSNDSLPEIHQHSINTSSNSSSSSSPTPRKKIDGSTFLSDMISAGLMKLVDNMMERQWSDPDLVDDLRVLNDLLHKNYKEMSTWDLYEAEVDSGSLTWGILHTQKFFRANIKRMEGVKGDFILLKKLISLVNSPDEDVAAIACFDIGEFVRHYPNGRHIAKAFGAKNVIMELINHDNPDIQRQALQCISKMMVQNWSAIQ